MIIVGTSLSVIKHLWFIIHKHSPLMNMTPSVEYTNTVNNLKAWKCWTHNSSRWRPACRLWSCTVAWSYWQCISYSPKLASPPSPHPWPLPFAFLNSSSSPITISMHLYWMSYFIICDLVTHQQHSCSVMTSPYCIKPSFFLQFCNWQIFVRLRYLLAVAIAQLQQILLFSFYVLHSLINH